MGIFSNADISEIEGIVDNELDRMRKLKFLSGFNVGWKKGKRLESDKQIIFRTVEMEYLKKFSINKNSKPAEAYYFGVAFGYLIGVVRFHPTYLLQHSDTFIGWIQDVESYQELYVPYLKTRLNRWSKNIQKSISTLNEDQVHNYKRIVKSI